MSTLEDIQLFTQSYAGLGLSNASDSHITFRLSSPYGLHITTHTTLTLPFLTDPSCTFHILFLLPPSVFVDKYELGQRHHDGSLPAFNVWGETDLELPVDVVDGRGSALMISLPSAGLEIGTDGERHVELEVPLHLRYMTPDDTDYVMATIPWPLGFSACAPATSVNVSIKPPSPIPTNSIITFLSPSSPNTVLKIEIPTGQARHLAFVEPVTALIVILAFTYVVISSWRASLALHQARLASKHE